MRPRIEPSFQELAPPLSPEERAQREASLLAEGCRDALVVWKGHDVLLDGHNRLELCAQLGLEYCKVEIDLPDRDAAKVWIIRNQFARRNLAPYQRAELALALEPLLRVRSRQGERTDLSPNSAKSEPLDSRAEVAKAAGLGHDTIAKAKKIRDYADEDTKAKLRRGETSIHATYVQVRREQKRGRARGRAGEAGALAGKYRVLYADPPWQYRHAGVTQDAESHYPTMALEEICALPVKEHTEDEAVLFLWVTSPKLEEAFAVIRAWGFRYKTSFVWDKVRHNVGHYNSVRHELLLIATRGACTPDRRKLFDSVQTIERSDRHSEKPEEFRAIIETLYTHGNKIELFARKTAPGWSAWGNEA